MKLRWTLPVVLLAQAIGAQPPEAQAQHLQEQIQQQAQQLQLQQQILSQQVQQGVTQIQLERQNEERLPQSAAALPAPAALGLPSGVWWERPGLIRELGLSSEQRSQMNDAWQQARLHLIDLNAALQKEQAILEPMLADDQADTAKINGQVDRIAAARANVDKANIGTQRSLRRVLTSEQRSKLAAVQSPR